MSISTIPTEIFTRILEHISVEDDIAVLCVNKKWNHEYRAVIERQHQDRFNEILYSSWHDWNIPYRLVKYIDMHEFLIDKLYSFCMNFGNSILRTRLRETYDSLKKELEKADKEREVIDKLLAHYEAQSDFEGWFPQQLWDRHKKTRYNSGAVIRKMNRVYTLIKNYNGYIRNRF